MILNKTGSDITRVLVVEDEPYRETLKRYLEVEAHWTVLVAATAHEAKEIIEQNRGSIDGIVLDRRMPNRQGVLEYTGDELARWLFDEDLLSAASLIMLTGFAEVGVTRDVLIMGGWNFLEKPIHPREVHRRLAPGIARKRSQKLLSWVHSGPTGEEVVSRVKEIIDSTLAPDHFQVYFHFDGKLHDLTAGGSSTKEPSFVTKTLTERSFVYGGTKDECRALDAARKDTSTLMAVRVEAFAEATPVGVMAMESHIDKAFDPRWQDVLFFLAQLIGTAMTVERAKMQAVAAEKMASETQLDALMKVAQAQKQALAARHAESEAKRASLTNEYESLKMVNRELRHRIATSVGTMFQHLELIETDLAPLGSNAQAIASKAEVVKRHLNLVVNVMKELELATKDLPDIKQTHCDPVLLVRTVISDELTGRAISHRIDCSDPALTLWADRDLLDYTIRCLIRNAVESIQVKKSRPAFPCEDGDFEKQLDRARSRSAAEIIVSIVKSERPGFGEIRVRDLGIGFDDQVKTRIFNALFTTKLARDEQGVDTASKKTSNRGMGLYSAKRFINSMGGDLSANSKGEDQGAEFTIALPMTPLERG